jgi:hypothetical protein
MVRLYWILYFGMIAQPEDPGIWYGTLMTLFEGRMDAKFMKILLTGMGPDFIENFLYLGVVLAGLALLRGLVFLAYATRRRLVMAGIKG